MTASARVDRANNIADRIKHTDHLQRLLWRCGRDHNDGRLGPARPRRYQNIERFMHLVGGDGQPGGGGVFRAGKNGVVTVDAGHAGGRHAGWLYRGTHGQALAGAGCAGVDFYARLLDDSVAVLARLAARLNVRKTIISHMQSHSICCVPASRAHRGPRPHRAWRDTWHAHTAETSSAELEIAGAQMVLYAACGLTVLLAAVAMGLGATPKNAERPPTPYPFSP